MYRLTRYSYPAPLLRGVVRNPWAGLESEIDRLFESALTDVGAPRAAPVPRDPN